MVDITLHFHPGRLSVSALVHAKCIKEIGLAVPEAHRSYDSRLKTLTVYGPTHMTRTAKIVRGFFPEAKTLYTAGYKAWRAGLPSATANHRNSVAAKDAAERVRAAEEARAKAERDANEARTRAERLAEELRRAKTGNSSSNSWYGSSANAGPNDPYTILGVQRGAPAEVIKAAYKALSKLYHPDLNKTPEAARRMQEINAAYDKLGVK